MMGVWYYNKQKEEFRLIQKLFLTSILLPIFIALGNCFLIEQKAVLVNLWVCNTFFLLWIFVFKLIGAEIRQKKIKDNFKWVFPLFFLIPFIYYFFILYPILSFLYAVSLFIYITLFSYMGILSFFLPINEDKRILIISGIVLFVFMGFMTVHDWFLSKMALTYPITRGLAMISRCMIIYGMIDYNLGKKINRNDVE